MPWKRSARAASRSTRPSLECSSQFHIGKLFGRRLAFRPMSRLPFELFLALRYLRPKRTFVSVITLISVLGVMLGVAVLIIVISVMTGFDQQLREKILGFGGDVKVYKYDDALADYAAVEQLVSSNRNVEAVAPFVLGQVLVKTQPATGKPVVSAPWLRGIDPGLEKNVTALTTSLISGELNLEGESL